MLKYTKRFLSIALIVYSVAVFINMIMLCWNPIYVCGELCSYTAMRLEFIAFAERRYYLIPICIFIVVMLFYTAVSIKRKQILFPILSFLYLAYDMIVLFVWLIEDLCDGGFLFWVYLIPALVDVTLIILIGVYCWSYFRQRHKQM